ncbi:MAG: RING-H2 finger protein [Candidatus Caldarchaeum sp.]|nr:RING-H2 finger protein [Candidatus Caldarchaeum sp.]
MTVTERRLLVRFFQIGSITALIGSIHILTLLLPWYVVRADTVSATVLSGYLLIETLALSSVGGVLAGIALLITSFSSKPAVVRLILSSLAIVGGVVCLLSPIYLNFVLIPSLNVVGEPELGFFVSFFSALGIVALGVLALVTRPQRVEVPYPGYYGMEQEQAAQPVETTSFEPVDSVEEGLVCPICYTNVTAENAVRCTSCGIVFHTGCLDAYVNINGTCPNCQRAAV